MLKYERFKATIIQVIQSSGLDVASVYYILKDILSEVQTLYNKQLQIEAQEEQQKQMEQSEEADETNND